MSDFEPGQIVVHRPESPVLAAAQIMDQAQFDNVFRMARALAASRMFKDVTQAEQAFGRILLGADLGLSPTQALMGVDVVEGNVQLRGTLLAKFVRQSPIYDYKVLERGFKPGAESAVVALYMRDEDGEWPRADEDTPMPHKGGTVTIKEGQRLPEAVEFYSVAEAKQAGLVKQDKPRSAWMAIPHVMVVWRALAQLVRNNAPDLLGGVPVYTEADSFEERQAIGDGEGDGTGPGWGDMAPELVERVEAVIARAEKVGLPAFATPEVIQVRLGGQPAEVVEDWIALAERELEAVENVPEAEVVPEGEHEYPAGMHDGSQTVMEPEVVPEAEEPGEQQELS